MVELAANVDDLDPRLWPGVISGLISAGALGAWVTPILMKKGRPAHTLTVLARSENASALADAMLSATPTFGVRPGTLQHRTVLDRSWHTVTVEGEKVRVKVGSREGRIVRVTPEFEDVARVAQTSGGSELTVLRAAEAAAAAAGLAAGEQLPG